jgi:methyl-accepting chemotaxis protein
MSTKQTTKKTGAPASGAKNEMNIAMEEVLRLVAEAKAGHLKERADLSKAQGEFKAMFQGINEMLDAVINPLNVAADYVDKISKGNIPPKITDNYNGDFNTIKTNLNTCVDAVNALVTDAGILSKAAVEGKLATRADASKHGGDFQKVVKGVNDCLDSVIGPLNVAAEYVDRISKGDIPPKITDNYNGDFNEIKNNLNRCIEAVNALVTDAGILSKAAVEGKLATRADASKHQGDFQKVVKGVNDCLDSVIGPLNVTAKYVEDISKGIIPPIITDNYNGDFNIIKSNLNTVVKMMGDLLKEADVIIKAAADGELDKRANAEMFLGGWKQLVTGINSTITNIVNPLMVTADYVDKVSKGVIPPQITDVYKGQYNIIKTNLNSVVKMMGDLLKEADVIIKAAADGELDKRANADMFLGGWKQLVTGINSTITNIVNPLMVTADYVEKVSKGVIPPQITDVYKGQYNIIKSNLNGVVKMMSELLTETDKLVKAALNGELGTRANAGLFVGGWNQLVAGVNSTLEAVIIPINEAQAVLEKVAARDMTARVKGDYKGDLGKIKDAINSAVDNLDEALTQVAEATEQVSSGSQQISSGAQSLAQGANDQASSLEEVSSSLEEMASMTKQNAENAGQAKTLAGEADSNANVGTEAMTRMSDSINKIKESSDKTAKIVKTIDEIAMQTNLLALNAAVEAARAGEAGRGFAVVAEEVRNLAQRSAEAAKNTADMISESVKNADNGVNIATEVSKSFGSIVQSVKKVNDLIAEIAAASQEQSQGIDQVNTAVAQMDKVTQQNAANSEESASAAEEMSSQAEELQSMIAQFALTQSATQKKPSAAVHHTAATVSHSKAPAQVLKHTAKPVLAKHSSGIGAKNLKHHDPIPMDDEALKEF